MVCKTLTDAICVVPYYDYQKENLNLQTKYQGDIYFSYGLQEKLNISRNDTITIHNSLVNIQNMTIGGILKKDYSLIQHVDKKIPCIYVPYKYFHYFESGSMVLELEDFEAFYQISENIKKINNQYNVILSQDTYLSQMSALDKLNEQINQFIIIIFILVIITFCINQLFVIYNQKYEIAVLKANGLSYYEILKLMLCWLGRQIFKSLIVISLFMISETIISVILGLYVNIFNPIIILLMLTMILGLHFLPTLLATVYISKIDTEKLLRF